MQGYVSVDVSSPSFPASSRSLSPPSPCVSSSNHRIAVTDIWECQAKCGAECDKGCLDECDEGSDPFGDDDQVRCGQVGSRTAGRQSRQT
jgi:hypothetical protein